MKTNIHFHSFMFVFSILRLHLFAHSSNSNYAGSHALGASDRLTTNVKAKIGNNILTINSNTSIITVEGGCTMEIVLKASTANNMIPKVLPEFRDITVGGAIVGRDEALKNIYISHKYMLRCRT